VSPEDETPLGPLPESITASDTVGGLAAVGNPDTGDVTVYLLVGGNLDGGFGGVGQARNEIFARTLSYNADTEQYELVGDWTLVADFTPPLEGSPSPGQVYQGLAALGQGVYTSTFADFDISRNGQAGVQGIGVEILDLTLNGNESLASLNMRLPGDTLGSGERGDRRYSPIDGEFFGDGLALDGANDRGSLFLLTSGGYLGFDERAATIAQDTRRPIADVWMDQFNGLVEFPLFVVWEYDPRNKRLDNIITYFDIIPESPDGDRTRGATPDFPDIRWDGLGYTDGTLTLTAPFDDLGGGRGESGGNLGRIFLTLDADTGQIIGGDQEFSDSGGSARSILGLAGPNYEPTQGPFALGSADDVDFESIDPVFGSLAFDSDVIFTTVRPDPTNGPGGLSQTASPFSALFTKHIVDTSLDPVAAFYSDKLNAIPDILLANANEVDGVAGATADLRFPLPPGHPASGYFGAPPLDVHTAGLYLEFGESGGDFRGGSSGGAFSQIFRNDLRFNGAQDFVDDREISDLFEPLYYYSAVEGGLTTRLAEAPDEDRGRNGAEVYRLLYGGRDSGGGFSQAFNEVYQLDLANGGGWEFLGKFIYDDFDGAQTDYFQGDQYNGQGAALSGLTSFGSAQGAGIVDYAIDHRGRVFELDYDFNDGSGGANGRAIPVADFAWGQSGLPDSPQPGNPNFEYQTAPSALASAEERGAVFAVGQYRGLVDEVQRGGFPLDDLVIYEFDPRNQLIKDTWWGLNGDFAQTPATARNLSDPNLFSPFEVQEIHGASWVPARIAQENGEHAGALTVIGRFSFTGVSGGSALAALSFDLDARGPNDPDLQATFSSDPFLMRVDDYPTGDSYAEALGAASIADGRGIAPPPIELAGDPQIDVASSARDIVGISPELRGLAYTERALDSGVLQQVMAYQFAYDGTLRNNVFQCNHSLIFGDLRDDLDDAFADNVMREDGLGAVYDQLGADPDVMDNMHCGRSPMPPPPAPPASR
jgi:hypothetical protein